MYTLKSIAQRGTLLGAVAALVVAAVIPAASVLADSLNPLTERSLLLSSSAPGFMDSDGAGNSEANPNAWNGGEYYSLPGSGPNGKKSGETFSFRVSTNSTAAPAGTGVPVKAFSLQYCTTAAGLCQAPGNNAGDATASTRLANEGTGGGFEAKTSDFNVVTDSTTPGTSDWSEGAGPGQYQVTLNGVPTTGWVMSSVNAEDTSPLFTTGLTGKNNFITLTNTTGIEPAFNEKLEIKFTPSTANYITNPGAGSFFVKINSYNTTTAADIEPATRNQSAIIDGGVTVANVMTDSIHITTKVLETMSFSVGTQNPDTQPVQHGSCQNMDVINNNRLDLGNPTAESSLETGKAYDTNSYWRLSSNSSGGATVYYSGDTLRNTVGDSIAPIGKTLVNPNGSRAHSQPGTEQFGLALVDAGVDVLDTVETFPPNHPSNWVTPQAAIWPLAIGADYNGGDLASISDINPALNAEFAFNEQSKSVPQVIAQNSDNVISCATSKVRYIGNIAADTPAGVYTTKINYLAAPQY